MNYNRLKKLYEIKGYSLHSVKPGQMVEINEKLGDRVWRFKGLVLSVKKPNNSDGTFTVRGTVANVVIEKTYPLSYPNFEKLSVVDEFKIRRAKLYYIREKIGKDAKLKSKRLIKQS